MSADRNPWAWSFGSLPTVSSTNRSNVMCSGIHCSGRASRSTGAATLEIRSQANGARTTTRAMTIAA